MSSVYGVRRSALSQLAPVLRSTRPGGNCWSRRVRFTTGPLTRYGSVGRARRSVARAGIGRRGREVDQERVREGRAGVDAAQQLEVRLVVEAAVAGANDALAAAEIVGHAEPRLDVVLVDRVGLDQRVVGLGERDDLEVVAQAEAQREPRRHPPLVLPEERDVGRLLVELARPADADREPVRVGPRDRPGLKSASFCPKAKVPFRLPWLMFWAPE